MNADALKLLRGKVEPPAMDEAFKTMLEREYDQATEVMAKIYKQLRKCGDERSGLPPEQTLRPDTSLEGSKRPRG